MSLLTTIQVRNIMRANGGRPAYTNKSKGHMGADRRVKCYYRGNAALVAALKAVAGAGNVTVTPGSDYLRSGGAGVTVKCVLA